MEWNYKNHTIRPWPILGVIFIILSTTLWAGVVYGIYYLVTSDKAGGEVAAETSGGATDAETATSKKPCNVYAETLHGILDTYAPPKGSDSLADITGSDVIVGNIRTAADKPEVKAVLLDIDSGGGSPVAADEIAKALRALGKPSVAVIHGYGDSAAYWAATGASVIFASPLSDVGSIGVTSSYLDNVGYNAKQGYSYQQLAWASLRIWAIPIDRSLPRRSKLSWVSSRRAIITLSVLLLPIAKSQLRQLKSWPPARALPAPRR